MDDFFRWRRRLRPRPLLLKRSELWKTIKLQRKVDVLFGEVVSTIVLRYVP